MGCNFRSAAAFLRPAEIISKKTIKPALARGDWVLCDRFADSTMAYQGYGHGLGRETIEAIQKLAISDFKPDLTLVLDVPVDGGLARAAGRSSGKSRYERMELDFHERVREGFLEVARREPQRCVVIDAQAGIADVPGGATTRHCQSFSGRDVMTEESPNPLPRENPDPYWSGGGGTDSCRRLDVRTTAPRLVDNRSAWHRQSDARISVCSLRAGWRRAGVTFVGRSARELGARSGGPGVQARGVRWLSRSIDNRSRRYSSRKPVALPRELLSHR